MDTYLAGLRTDRNIMVGNSITPEFSRHDESHSTLEQEVFLSVKPSASGWIVVLERWDLRLNDADIHLCDEAKKDAFINDNMKCFKFFIFRGEIDYELTRVVKCAGSDSLIQVYIQHSQLHGGFSFCGVHTLVYIGKPTLMSRGLVSRHFTLSWWLLTV